MDVTADAVAVAAARGMPVSVVLVGAATVDQLRSNVVAAGRCSSTPPSVERWPALAEEPASYWAAAFRPAVDVSRARRVGARRGRAAPAGRRRCLGAAGQRRLRDGRPGDVDRSDCWRVRRSTRWRAAQAATAGPWRVVGRRTRPGLHARRGARGRRGSVGGRRRDRGRPGGLASRRPGARLAAVGGWSEADDRRSRMHVEVGDVREVVAGLPPGVGRPDPARRRQRPGLPRVRRERRRLRVARSSRTVAMRWSGVGLVAVWSADTSPALTAAMEQVFGSTQESPSP